MSMMNYFKTMVLVMIFFSFGINILVYSMPTETLNYFDPYNDFTNNYPVQNISNSVEGSLQKSKNLPVIELGALVFYSGNFFLDLLLNFAFAVPIMFGLLVSGLQALFGFDPMFVSYIEGFVTVTVSVLYLISLFEFITNIRSQRGII